MIVAVLAAVPAVGQSATQQSLEQAKARVQEVTDRIGQAESRAEDARMQLEEARTQLRKAEDAVNEVARLLERQRKRVEQAAEELESLRARARQLQEDFQRRAVSMFKNGGGSRSLELLLASGNLQDAISRSAYMRVLSSGTAATLEDVRTSRVAVREQRKLLTAEREQLREVQEERKALLREVRRIRESRAVAAADAEERVQHLHERKDELEADRDRIEELIEQRKQAADDVGVASAEGYVWPACGPVTSEYGYRWGRLHAGIDIADPPDTIHAANAGRVIFTGYRGGYGNMTLIQHSDGIVTAYAHQRQQYVQVGQTVAQGEAIGLIGATGNVTGAHLHFETRVNGSAVNPRQYLPGGGGC